MALYISWHSFTFECDVADLAKERPSAGDVLVSEHSIANERNLARAQMGICPQFNAIDSHLTGERHFL